MIPTYRPDKKYLQQTLESVLRQAAGPDQMQIEVVDDCSPEMDVAALVKSIAGNRVSFSSTPKNLGLAGCFNTIIERSHGQWVHILNHDDYVLPGFYQILAQAAEHHPEISLLATRCFFIDGDGVITGVSMRLKNMEHGTCAPDDWFYYAPFQSP
jgi:GT2 family glycosyltransferase